MAVSVSAILLLLIMTVVFLRSGSLKVSHALVCVFLGFYLAGSSVAPSIQNGLTATANVVSSLHP
ncbi:hypothetical protein G3I60_26575 [Streptomyces sp. SID13666]|uniref:Secreted protein n=1 Tax=Streptomyces fildesensis TaxID=375757 RepID=A0ABW8CCA1_9ACTN|nr:MULTISPECIES: hypothetical protein [Streptomyces]MCM2420506.1 hypothetical protein [Streptomyces sp. RKAG293]MCM2427276.1 hypothetical protein [Streptomyces sp. RKAG337]MCZ4094891.1 hypothetical protein [Streptomyces sp. H39-C1]NEA57627.1 hypothetical protein [Streptomyces sp. SID13666]NEA72577.1 hypothetical protein [Streptomyces sp. SID13588]